MYTRRMAQATKRKMFLSWLLINVLSLCLITVLFAGGFASGVGGAPVYALVAILLIGGAASGWMGYLSWKADDLIAKPSSPARQAGIASVLHDAAPVYYAVAVCQLVGLVGALMGYRQEAHSAALPDASQAIKALTLGLGNGLTATLFGVVLSLLIWVQVLFLTHRLEHPNR